MGCALQPALTTLPRPVTWKNKFCVCPRATSRITWLVFVLTLVFAGPKTGQVQPVHIGVLDFGGPCYPPPHSELSVWARASL